MRYLAILTKKDGTQHILKSDSLEGLRLERSKFTATNKNEKYISTAIVKPSTPLSMQFKAVIKGVHKHG